MFRTVVAVVVGYVVIAIVVMLVTLLAMLQPSWAFEADAITVRPGWLAILIAASIVGAVLGGLTAAFVGQPHSRRAVLGLALFCLVLGFVSAFANNYGRSELPSAEALRQMSMAERMQYARQPTWFAFSLPLMGALGVLAGGYGFMRWRGRTRAA